MAKHSRRQRNKKNQNINLSVHEDLIPANEPYFHQVKAPAQMCHSYALGRTFLRFSASFSFLPLENPEESPLLCFVPSRNPDRTNGHATQRLQSKLSAGFCHFFHSFRGPIDGLPRRFLEPPVERLLFSAYHADIDLNA